jgi:hypothetical protein
VAPDGRILFVHCVAACDHGNHATRPYVKALGKKVVVDRVGQVRTAPIRRIVDRIVAERDVSNCRIEVVLRKRRILEGLSMNGRFRVEGGGDARRNRIQLDTRPPCTGIQGLRHQPKEMPDTHRRLKDLRAGLQAELFYRLPDCLNDFGRRIVRIWSRGPSRRVLLCVQQIFQIIRDALPFRWRLEGKCIRHRAPTCVLNERRLFFWGSVAVFSFYGFQSANGSEVGLSLLLQAALADAVGGGYAEIAGNGWCGSRVAGSNDNWV